MIQTAIRTITAIQLRSFRVRSRRLRRMAVCRMCPFQLHEGWRFRGRLEQRPAFLPGCGQCQRLPWQPLRAFGFQYISQRAGQGAVQLGNDSVDGRYTGQYGSRAVLIPAARHSASTRAALTLTFCSAISPLQAGLTAHRCLRQPARATRDTERIAGESVTGSPWIWVFVTTGPSHWAHGQRYL